MHLVGLSLRHNPPTEEDAPPWTRVTLLNLPVEAELEVFMARFQDRKTPVSSDTYFYELGRHPVLRIVAQRSGPESAR